MEKDIFVLLISLYIEYSKNKYFASVTYTLIFTSVTRGDNIKNKRNFADRN